MFGLYISFRKIRLDHVTVNSNSGTESASRLIIRVNKHTENVIELKTVAGRVHPNTGNTWPCRFKQNEPYPIEFQTKMPVSNLPMKAVLVVSYKI
jgi:hypothetical protein